VIDVCAQDIGSRLQSVNDGRHLSSYAVSGDTRQVPLTGGLHYYQLAEGRTGGHGSLHSVPTRQQPHVADEIINS